MFFRKLKKRVTLAEQTILQLNKDIQILNFKLTNKPKFKKGDTIAGLEIIGDALVCEVGKTPFIDATLFEYQYRIKGDFIVLFSESKLLELQKQENEKREKEYKKDIAISNLGLAVALAIGACKFLSHSDENKPKKDKKSKKEKNGKSN